MSAFFEAESLTAEEIEKIASEIENRIREKLESGTFTEREIREIEEMRLRPLADIQDVRSVYEDHLFEAER